MDRNDSELLRRLLCDRILSEGPASDDVARMVGHRSTAATARARLRPPPGRRRFARSANMAADVAVADPYTFAPYGKISRPKGTKLSTDDHDSLTSIGPLDQLADPKAAALIETTGCRASENDPATARRFDQYYTDPILAAYCLEIVRRYYDFSQMLLVEPSAGDGSFSRVMPKGSIAVDIDPRADGIQKADFLEITIESDWQIGFIGNPPYGWCSRKALAFINRAALCATFIAFILPRTFRKANTQAKIDRSFHQIHDEDMPDHAFLFCGKPYNVPAVFQIWERRAYERELPPKATEHSDFVFTEPARADFAIQRVGAAAGRIHYDFSLSASSHLFILGKVQHRMRRLDFASVAANTAGNPSISKSEIVSLYSKLTGRPAMKARIKKVSAKSKHPGPKARKRKA